MKGLLRFMHLVVLMAVTTVGCSKAPLPNNPETLDQEQPAASLAKLFVLAAQKNGQPLDSAEVYLDGKFIGSTPIFDKSVTLGTHALRVQKIGFEIYATTVLIPEPREVYIEALLAPLPVNKGQLLITVDPDSALTTVTNIGNVLIGEFQSREVALVLEPGGYFVKAAKPGYAPALKAVSVKTDSITIQNITLERLPDTRLPQIVLAVPDVGKVNEPVVINWESTLADRVDIDYIENPGLSGRREIVFTTPGSREIKATAYNRAGQTSVADTILIYREVVNAVPPTLSFAVTPDSVKVSEPVQISWNSNGYQVVIDQGIGLRGPTGTEEVIFKNIGKKVFTAVAYGDNNLTTVKKDSVVVYSEVVNSEPPTLDFAVTPDSVKVSEPVRVSWSSNGYQVVMDQGIGVRSPAGSEEVIFKSPGKKLFTAVAYGTNNLKTVKKDSVIVYTEVVNPEPPTLDFVVTPDYVNFSEPVYVSWNSNGHQVVIDQGIGVRGPTGNEEIIFQNPGKKVFTAIAYGTNNLKTIKKDSVFVREPEKPGLPDITLAVVDSVEVGHPATIEWHSWNASRVDVDYVENPGLNGKVEKIFTTPGLRVITATAYNQAGQTTVKDTLVVVDHPTPAVEPQIVPSGAKVVAIYSGLPQVWENAGQADIKVPGFYKVTAHIWYDSGDSQKNESLFVLVKNGNGTLQTPLDPNAGPYKVVPDDPGPPHITDRDAGTFYFSQGMNTFQVHHYYTIANQYPQFLVDPPITGPESVQVIVFKLEFLYAL